VRPAAPPPLDDHSHPEDLDALSSPGLDLSPQVPRPHSFMPPHGDSSPQHLTSWSAELSREVRSLRSLVDRLVRICGAHSATLSALASRSQDGPGVQPAQPNIASSMDQPGSPRPPLDDPPPLPSSPPPQPQLASAELPTAPSTARICRRFTCRGVVLPSCCTGYCQQHCSSPRCTCQSTLAESAGQPIGDSTGPTCQPPPEAPQRHQRRMNRSDGDRPTCRSRGCTAVVHDNCSTGYCRIHCTSRRCPCHGQSLSRTEQHGDHLHALLEQTARALPNDLSCLPRSLRHIGEQLRPFARRGNGSGARR